MCDMLVIVSSGRVVLAMNSDRDPNEAQGLDWHPRRDHPPGAKLRCTWMAIPQVEHTHAVLLSRPYWMWGAQMGTNEHGVVIGTAGVRTTAPLAKVGLTGMDLVRLALERADSAKQAVEVLTALLVQHGQGGGTGHERRTQGTHASFLVADHTSAWVVESVGELWSADQVIEGVRTMTNALSIPTVAASHADHLRDRILQTQDRRARTEELARRVTGIDDLFTLLRDHGTDDGLPTFSRINGAMGGPCVHAGGLVTASQTTASWVSDLRPDAALHWATSTAAPCTGLFKPVAVSEPTILGPNTEDVFDAAAPWWRHELRHRVLLRNVAELVEGFASERDDVERAWVAQPPTTAQAFAAADHLLDEWVAREVRRSGDLDNRPAYLRRYWSVRNGRARLPVPASSRAAADHA